MTTPNAKNRASQPAMATADGAGTGGGPAARMSQPAIPRRGNNVADKREAILGAALGLFVERGFWGTAVPEIADRAGVGAGTIYRYFESKEALVNAIYRQEKMRFSSSVLEQFPANVNTREQFRTIWMRMAAFATANPSAFIFLELHHHASYLDNESRSVEQRMLEIITAVVHAAQQRRELKPGNTKLLMGMVMGAFVGVTRSCLDFGQPLDAADWAFAEQCVWEAIRS
ncbi:MAG: TetR family transcriptional regulator [Myxococcota bacterium]|nr:TetR/AcrR family transcriptional regulator [Deltaproteobacteria bacterium]MDQ3341031.1 TetR family transcriptional regulator [Myxococcota bacterium]